MKTFTEFSTERHHSEFEPGNTDVLSEALSPRFVKTAAVGILMRIGQLRQSVVQDRTANSADKAFAGMLFLLSSMLAASIGAMESPVQKR